MHNREVNINQPQQRGKEEDKMKFTKRNWGQLWYNIDTQRVERVVNRFNGSRVTTVWHGYTQESRVKETSLIKANGAQLKDYKKESADLKEKALARSRVFTGVNLPPLPRPDLVSA